MSGIEIKSKRLGVILGLVIALWVTCFVVLLVFFKDSLNNTGVFGDSFGVVNALFSGLAFAAVYYALSLQREDIELTRNEVKRQNFENTFFQMLRLHNDIVSRSGREFFIELSDSLDKDFTAEKLYGTSNFNVSIKNINDYFIRHKNKVGHYTKFLLTIFEFIRDEHENVKNRQRYIKIVFTQLSKPEMQILIYFLVSEHAEEHCPLIKDLSLLDYFDDDIYLVQEHKTIIQDTINNRKTPPPPKTPAP